MHARWRRLAAASFFLLPMLGGSAAQAQSYPTHPVRLISDSAPGSAIDVTMRIIAGGLDRVWGQQAVVINQPGAGGAIAAHNASTAEPNGYTLGMMALSAFVAPPGLADNLPIRLPKDFIPIGYLGGAPLFITAAPWVGVKTLPELIAKAKQEPGKLAYGANGVGRCRIPGALQPY
jgi:tripartite-type tricarboxylate transporter receptor subunit TctC